jgi:hypothetical protein
MLFPHLRPLPYALAFLLAAGLAQAETRQMEATGSSLAVDSPCARAVTVEPDASLSGKAVAVATAEHPEELAQLAFDSQGTAKLHVPAEKCWRDGDGAWEPTLTIAVRVPVGFPLTVSESGGADYTIGDVGGKLALEVSGGAQLKAARATEVSLDLSGGGEVTLGSVSGPLKASVSGGGTITVAHAVAPSLDLDISGGGTFDLTDGSVAKLALDLSGGGDVKLGGTVGDATLDVSGAGSVHIAKVTGSVTKDVTGAGSVDIGD